MNHTFWFAADPGGSVRFNGLDIPTHSRKDPMHGTDRSAVDYELRPGESFTLTRDAP